tara:strand:- start:256 stop:387 length:132 start_codon:yes stop_codon:yes gene_type:complete
MKERLKYLYYANDNALRAGARRFKSCLLHKLESLFNRGFLIVN